MIVAVSVEYDVRPDEHLPDVGNLHLHAECGCTGAAQPACAFAVARAVSAGRVRLKVTIGEVSVSP